MGCFATKRQAPAPVVARFCSAWCVFDADAGCFVGRLTDRGGEGNIPAVPVGRIGDEPKGRGPPTKPQPSTSAHMPTLETLKKQAKLLVRRHHERLHTVAPQIRSALPRFAGLSDAEVLDRPFTLADAQSLLAAERGYPTWAALKASLAAETGAKAPATAGAKPKMRLVEATLFVTDFAASLRYFSQVLGFATVFTYGEPPYFGQVARDGVPINLRYVCEPVFVGDVREREDLCAAVIGVSGVKALFEEFRAAGAKFHQGLKRHPWGAIDFVVKDPDGNLISFGWGSADEA